MDGILKGEDRHNIQRLSKRGEFFLWTVGNQTRGCLFMESSSEWDEMFGKKDPSEAYLYLHR